MVFLEIERRSNIQGRALPLEAVRTTLLQGVLWRLFRVEGKVWTRFYAFFGDVKRVIVCSSETSRGCVSMDA